MRFGGCKLELHNNSLDVSNTPRVVIDASYAYQDGYVGRGLNKHGDWTKGMA